MIDEILKINNPELLKQIIQDNLHLINVISLYNKRNKNSILKNIHESGIGLTFTEKLYNFINNNFSVPICEVCNKNPIKWQGNLKKGYFLTCSVKCFPKHPTYLQNYKNGVQKNYGVDNPAQSKDVQNKIKTTIQQRYGVKNGFQTNNAKEKLKQASLIKYGTDHHLSSKECHEKIKTTYFKKLWDSKITAISKIAKPCFNKDEFTSVEKDYKWHCINCDKVFSDNIKYGGIPRCPSCNRLNGRSKKEQEVFEFIQSCLPTEEIQISKCILKNNKQIDIFIPNKNIAIEFNGLYWHSLNAGMNKTYHLEKTKEALKQNIKLIHLFEDDWIYKNDIIKSRLKNILGIIEHKIGARNCIISKISSKDAQHFFEINHLFGNIPSQYNLALIYNNEIVSCMSFGKPRFSKNYDYELLRFANKLNLLVPGAASKLFSFFKNSLGKNKTIISYADRCWGDGDIYKILGFKFSHYTQPAIWYVDKKVGIRKSRTLYQKHKLSKILEHFDPNLTELQNMMMNNYLAITDCGNGVYVYSEEK